MSTDARPKNVFQIRRDKIAEAIRRWREAEGGRPISLLADVDALVDFLDEQGLQILPTSASHSRFRVLVDGRPAPYPGQEREAGPLRADEAAEVFLIAALGAEETGVECDIVVRPATHAELVQGAVLGDTTVREEPATVEADYYVTASSRSRDYGEIQFVANGGRTVKVRMGYSLFEELASSLHEVTAEDVHSEVGA